MTITTTSQAGGGGMFATDALQGKAILITGGGSGLGLAMARRFLALGARVAITGRSQERLSAAAQELNATSDWLFTRACDVREPPAVEALVEEVWQHFGGIDVTVNNAAGNFLAATEDLSANAFDAVVRI